MDVESEFYAIAERLKMDFEPFRMTENDYEQIRYETICHMAKANLDRQLGQ